MYNLVKVLVYEIINIVVFFRVIYKKKLNIWFLIMCIYEEKLFL